MSSHGRAAGSGEYDVVVVGGGSAGLAAVQTAARARARVLLVAEGDIGGDCTFTGCVPSKTLLEAAARGVLFEEAMAAVRANVARIAATEDASVLRSHGIEVLRGRARLAGGGVVEVDGTHVVARRIVLATGSAPVLPLVVGLTELPADRPALTTDTIFDLAEAPSSLAVLGGGPTGCELAQAFARLGVRVTLVEAAGRLLPDAEPEVSAVIRDALAADGVEIRAGSPVENVADLDVERVLVTTGRRPATANLGLEAAGVRTDERGYLVVDAHLATTAEGVYAAGDVTGLSGHTHDAYAMGRVAVQVALTGPRRRRPTYDPAGSPQVVFTDPEVATVGITEREAGPRARVAHLPMAEVDRAVTAGATAGFVTLVAGPRPVVGNLGGGRLLGATIVARRAGELIHEPALALRTGMFTGRLAQTVHAYPTWSVAVQQAAAQFFGGYGGRTARPPRRGARPGE
ncbi:NAD(P)/FAD-dependent oxidoreductase [Isoptericola halotolerans]|uniref:dihydrolipoyl dehydrogenase family protein n=1 Tax=Isoptericola halotolerans TaxID=300560 RepID=UPI00388FAE8C